MISRQNRGIPVPSFGPFPTATPLRNVPPAPGESDTGGIVGGIIDLVGGVIGGRSPGLPSFPQAPTGQRPPLPGTGDLGRSGPDFTLGGEIPPGNGASCPTCCKGFHPNKSRGCDGMPPGSKCVKNRRMNPLNPRALKRAVRRAKGFERAVKANRKALRSLAKI